MRPGTSATAATWKVHSESEGLVPSFDCAQNALFDKLPYLCKRAQTSNQLAAHRSHEAHQPGIKPPSQSTKLASTTDVHKCVPNMPRDSQTAPSTVPQMLFSIQDHRRTSNH